MSGRGFKLPLIKRGLICQINGIESVKVKSILCASPVIEGLLYIVRVKTVVQFAGIISG